MSQTKPGILVQVFEEEDVRVELRVQEVVGPTPVRNKRCRRWGLPLDCDADVTLVKHSGKERGQH
jgi:hypothetical protein